jgi:hypothetical protein
VEKRWYLRSGEQELGPFHSEQLRQLIVPERIRPEHLVRLHAETEWIRVGSVPELWDAVAARERRSPSDSASEPGSAAALSGNPEISGQVAPPQAAPPPPKSSRAGPRHSAAAAPLPVAVPLPTAAALAEPSRGHESPVPRSVPLQGEPTPRSHDPPVVNSQAESEASLVAVASLGSGPTGGVRQAMDRQHGRRRRTGSPASVTLGLLLAAFCVLAAVMLVALIVMLNRSGSAEAAPERTAIGGSEQPTPTPVATEAFPEVGSWLVAKRQAGGLQGVVRLEGERHA